MALEQDLKFITEGLKFSGVFAFDTYNKNTIVRSKEEELWEAESYRDEKGQLVLKKIAECFRNESKKRGEWGQTLLFASVIRL